jgi:TonB family protein
MCCKSWKTFLPFLATFLIGVLAAVAFQGLKSESNISEVKDVITLPYENGNGGGRKTSCGFESRTKSLQILSKTKANYTDAARTNQTQGTVTLRVMFLANGKIGDVAVVNYLPDGLTEQAIEAAKQMKFEPAKVNGVAQTVTKQVQYTFTLY